MHILEVPIMEVQKEITQLFWSWTSQIRTRKNPI